MKAVKLTKEPFICLHVSIEFRHFKGCFDRTQTINQKTFWILKLINVSVNLLPSVNTNVEPDVTVWLIDLFLIVFWKTLSSMTQRNTIYQAFDIHSTCRWWLFFYINRLLCFFQWDLLTERHISNIGGLINNLNPADWKQFRVGVSRALPQQLNAVDPSLISPLNTSVQMEGRDEMLNTSL